MEESFGQRLDGFVNALQAYYNTELPARYGDYPGRSKPVIEVEDGIKRARIVVQDSQRMVYCFIDKSNGDILKAEGYRKPATGKRGSIWNEGYDVGNGRPADLHGGGLYIRR